MVLPGQTDRHTDGQIDKVHTPVMSESSQANYRASGFPRLSVHDQERHMSILHML